MSRNPYVSVVIPTHRRSYLVGRAVASVLDQSYHDCEVIVVDDNGVGHPEQRATERLLQEQFRDERVRYIANDISQGGSEARNVGIRHSRGQLIAFLDDDEDWLPEKLQRQVALMDSSATDVAVVDCGFYDHKSSGRIRTVSPKMQGWILERLLHKTGGRPPKLSTLLCRREALERIGGFDRELPAREDYDLYVRLARFCRFDSVMEPLANKRADAECRLTSNPNNIVCGFERIYAKIAADLEARPQTHAIFLLKFSSALCAAGRRREAGQYWYRAARLRPFNPRLMIYGIKLLRASLSPP